MWTLNASAITLATTFVLVGRETDERTFHQWSDSLKLQRSEVELEQHVTSIHAHSLCLFGVF